MTLTIDSIRSHFRKEPSTAVTHVWDATPPPEPTKTNTPLSSLYQDLYTDLYKPSYLGWTTTTVIPPHWRTYADVPSKSNTEIFRDAGRYIEEHGWTQGQYTAADGSVCLVGAIMAVANAEDTGRVIAYLYWKMGGSPVMWNDTVGRTKDEVLSLLNHLAGRRELMYTIDKELELTPA